MSFAGSGKKGFTIEESRARVHKRIEGLWVRKNIMRNKNPFVTVNRTLYELYFTTENAEHICKRFNQPDDPASHLSFTDIEDVVINNNLQGLPAKAGTIF